MQDVCLQFFPARAMQLVFLVAISLVACAVAAAQPRANAAGAEQPGFTQFGGVSIGMPADQVRKKLNGLRDKGDDVDIFMVKDNQSVEVYYDKAKTVSAISIDFMSGAHDAPAAKDVVGSDADPRADGSVYKLVRYPKAGYWISYSKTAGDSPTITITMQKIEH